MWWRWRRRRFRPPPGLSVKIIIAMLSLLLSGGCAGGQAAMPPPLAGASVTATASAEPRLVPARINAPVAPRVALTPPRQAFLDGYNAYLAHDPARAGERLSVA